MKRIIGLLLIAVMLLGCATTYVNFNTNVDDARVIVDGVVLGQTPIDSVKMKNSTRGYQIIIEKEGYQTYQGRLRTEDNGPALAAVIIGYSLSFLILPLLLLINLKYTTKPIENQYFILEEIN